MNEINYNITSLIDILGLVQGVFLGLLLVIDGRHQRPKLFLGLFLIVFSAELLNSILEDLSILEQKPSLLFIPFNFYYLTVPLFYLYVRRISNSMLSKKKVFLILLPGIVEFIFYTILFLQTSEQKLNLNISDSFAMWSGLFTLLSVPYSLYYGILTIKHINKHKENVENYYSNTQGKLLLWAKGVIVFILVFTFFMFSSLFLDEEYFSEYAYPTLSAINVLFIFWIGISGIRQSRLFESRNLSSNEKSIENRITTLTNIKTVPENQHYLRLTESMVEEKIFLEPNISLAELSKKLGISQRNLSELIRENSNWNFNQFINYYRVEEAKKLLKDSSNDNLNMLGIAYDAGFNSKASFYSVFKNFTSLTPAAFKDGNLS